MSRIFTKQKLKILTLATIFLFAGSSVFSATDYALDFDGVNDYVDCGNDASLNFGTGDFSFEIWIKGNSDYYYQTLMAKSYQEKILSIFNDKPNFYIYDGANWAEVEAPNPVNDGQWHHIVGTRSSSTIMIYVDGDYKAQTDASAVGDTNSVEYLTINDGSFEGFIKKVRIYNRALSSTEINEHYSNIFNNETGLKLYLPMNEGTGNIVYDSSGLGNNGTIYGAIWEKIEANFILLQTSDITALLAHVGTLVSDVNIPMMFAIGLPLGFWVIKRTIKIVGTIREMRKPFP